MCTVIDTDQSVPQCAQPPRYPGCGPMVCTILNVVHIRVNSSSPLWVGGRSSLTVVGRREVYSHRCAHLSPWYTPLHTLHTLVYTVMHTFHPEAHRYAHLSHPEVSTGHTPRGINGTHTQRYTRGGNNPEVYPRWE